jgi:hypothetical protein
LFRDAHTIGCVKGEEGNRECGIESADVFECFDRGSQGPKVGVNDIPKRKTRRDINLVYASKSIGAKRLARDWTKRDIDFRIMREVPRLFDM